MPNWKRIRFPLRLLRLAFSVAAEGFYNLAWLLAFPFCRRRWRRRVRAVLARGGTACLALLLWTLPGCQEFPGSSLEKQVDETAWTLRVLAEQPRWWQSLEDDVTTVLDPELDQLPGTVSMLGW